jgi:predicted AAA+ superfamily ATPase
MSFYNPRLLDPVLADYLSYVPAFAIDGIKAVGKTSSAERLVSKTYKLDKTSTRELLGASPSTFLNSQQTVLLDEWQRMPEIWDEVRRAVDEDNRPGRFILTGSAVPKGAAIHSGAGRITRIQMRPLSLAERMPEEAVISLNDVLLMKTDKVEGSTNIGLETYLEEIIRSGFPGVRRLPTKGAELFIESYLKNLFEKEFEDQGYVVRKPRVLRNWLRAYAAATGSTASYQVILDAATPDDKDKPAKKTTLAYREILDKLWITDRVEPWLPLNSQFKYLGMTAKHYLADPAFAARLLGITMDNFLDDSSIPSLGPQQSSIAGRLFESLVALSLQTYAQVIGAQLSHFRTSSGDHEVDFIIEKGKHIAAIEVKLSASFSSNQDRHLKWFEKTFSEYNVVKILITTGDTAYTRQDGTHVVPAVMLGI